MLKSCMFHSGMVNPHTSRLKHLAQSRLRFYKMKQTRVYEEQFWKKMYNVPRDHDKYIEPPSER